MMTTHDEDCQPNDLAALETQLRRTRATITRRRASLRQALRSQEHFIRDALHEGLPPKKVARLTGLTAGRISQIRSAGGETVSMFDLM